MTKNNGAFAREYETVDMSGGISGAGVHAWDPAANTGFDDPLEVAIVGQSDAGYVIEWDHVNGGQFQVKYADYDAASDGALIDVPAGTAVGEVKVRVEGRR